MKKIIGGLFLVLILTICALPVFANTSSWNFTMDLEKLDGEKNKVYHSMNSGDLIISGDVWTYSTDHGPAKNPVAVRIWIYQSVKGIDRNVGSVMVTPTNKLNQKIHFEKLFRKQQSGKYYFYIFKLKNDCWNVKGAGTLKTK